MKRGYGTGSSLDPGDGGWETGASLKNAYFSAQLINPVYSADKYDLHIAANQDIKIAEVKFHPQNIKAPFSMTGPSKLLDRTDQTYVKVLKDQVKTFSFEIYTPDIVLKKISIKVIGNTINSGNPHLVHLVAKKRYVSGALFEYQAQNIFPERIKPWKVNSDTDFILVNSNCPSPMVQDNLGRCINQKILCEDTNEETGSFKYCKVLVEGQVVHCELHNSEQDCCEYAHAQNFCTHWMAMYPDIGSKVETIFNGRTVISKDCPLSNSKTSGNISL